MIYIFIFINNDEDTNITSFFLFILIIKIFTLLIYISTLIYLF